jgi:hypothetical protein
MQPDHFLVDTDVRRMWRLSHIARHVGIPRGTLKSAAAVGTLMSWRTTCGLTVTTLEAVYLWQLNRLSSGGESYEDAKSDHSG